MAKLTMDKLVALCKNRGIIYAGSEIYGGLANTWDYGHLGCEIKNNIKRAWWKKFVSSRADVHGLDSAILMNPTVWQASGHLGGFSDPLMDCRECKTRHRADSLIENYVAKKNLELKIAALSNKEMQEFIRENKIVCPSCGKSNFTDIKNFNLMFKTFQGVTEDTADTIYLRPETAQGIFVNFKSIARTTRAKLPFGVGQIGKSFRNEITPGNFIFRVREFEQMELEFFCKPGTDLEWFEYWKNFCYEWLLSLGIKKENLHMRDHEKDELSHYSNATTDFEYDFPFGRGELWGVADRTDFDLKCHQEKSGENMEYTDPFTGEQFLPYCIEPSVGVERLMLAFLSDAYDEELLEGGETRVVLRLHPELAPYKAAIFPLQKNLTEQAEKIYSELLKSFSCTFDVSGNIGKRYRRQDEIGTPYCITVDYETENDGCVTIRDRDSMTQERIPVNSLKEYLQKRLEW